VSEKLIVGFGFRARNGKDTLAAKVADELRSEGLKVAPMALADDLKAFARVLGMKEKNGPLLQALGTDVFRALDEDIWVKCLEARVQESDADVILVTDVRFKNEARWITSQGGVLVRVDRIMEDGSTYVAPDRDPNHRSETELKGAHFDLYFQVPNGDMDAMDRAAHTVCCRVRTRRFERACADINVHEFGVTIPVTPEAVQEYARLRGYAHPIERRQTTVMPVRRRCIPRDPERHVVFGSRTGGGI
jgi:hypothetical protein